MKTFKITSVLGLILASLCFSGCNTVDGVGKDIERGGEKLQNASK